MYYFLAQSQSWAHDAQRKFGKLYIRRFFSPYIYIYFFLMSWKIYVSASGLQTELYRNADIMSRIECNLNTSKIVYQLLFLFLDKIAKLMAVNIEGEPSIVARDIVRQTDASENSSSWLSHVARIHATHTTDSAPPAWLFFFFRTHTSRFHAQFGFNQWSISRLCYNSSGNYKKKKIK